MPAHGGCGLLPAGWPPEAEAKLHRFRGADEGDALVGIGQRWRRVSGENLFSVSNRIEQPVAALIQVFDYRTKINGLVCEPAILRDFGLVQNAKSVPLEKFESASAVESNNLGMDLFDSVIAEKSKVGFQKLSTHGNGPYLG
jgi:hypothetical protein